jgi:3-mercaptopyruvate sulfurtransferase SseA
MRFITSFFVIAIFAVAVLTACNSAETRRSATPAQGAPTPSDGVRRITVAELKAMMDNNEAVVIDVRNEASYNAAHIKGAKLIPEADLLKHLDELPRDKTIVTYCS